MYSCSDKHYIDIREHTVKSITSANANRHFSAMLRDVAAGEEVVVVSRGKPVARITAVHAGDASRQLAKIALLNRLRSQPALGSRTWKRADLYE